MAVIPIEATNYLADKQLKTSWHWDEVYASEHNVAFTVAKVMEQDVLDSIHRHIVRAVESGQTFHSFKRDLLQKLGQSGWGKYQEIDRKTGEVLTRLSDSRLKKVYETNVTQAYHAGAWQRFQDGKDHLPYLRYRIGPSHSHERAGINHDLWDGLVLPVDDPWWQTHMPMNGWGCKCWVQAISQADAEQHGISHSPKIEYHDWKNQSTGRTHKVPKGIDPGFEHNVGMARQQKHLDLLTDKIRSVASHSPDRAANAIHRLVDGAIFAHWLKKPQGNFPVALLAEDSAKKIQARSRVVLLSPDTMLKQVLHHGELDVTDYRSLLYSLTPKLVEPQKKNYHVMVVYYHHRYYRAILKSADNGNEVFLVSFSRLSKGALQNLKNQQAKK